MQTLISVTIVTYNSRRFIDPCLKSVFFQHHRPIEVIVVDNASTDGTLDLLAQYGDRIRLIRNSTNVGFAAAQNQAIAASRGCWVLVVNPDVCLTPAFIGHLVDAGERYAAAGVGTVCGRLLAMTDDMTIPARPLIDSAGIYFTPALRHFDRGFRQPAAGNYETPEYVFGASAAAAMYRREMIADVSVNGEFFDPDFFMYREDADLAWRAQAMGWKALYVPSAAAYHVRTAHCDNRAQLPADINMHSVKNRFLMRLKNMGWALCLHNLTAMVVRDIGVVAYCLLVERSSLRAFVLLAKCFKGGWQKRQWIQRRRRVPDAELVRWFRFRPVSFPAVLPAAPAVTSPVAASRTVEFPGSRIKTQA